MQYTLFIQGSPFSTKACHSAYRFAAAALDSGQYTINGVFFLRRQRFNSKCANATTKR